jgi:unspecific monooxygenase
VHTRLRTLVNRAFVSRQVERLRPEVTALANELIDGFKEAREVELLARFGAIIPVTIIARMLGVPEEDGPQLLDWSHRMVRMYLFDRSDEDEIAANAASGAFAEYLRGRIAEKRARPGDDLLTHMIGAEANGEKLSEAELISTTILLLNAGHEATVHQIGNAVKTILQTGDDPAELFADEKTTALTIEECLRYAPPLHLFMRYALSDIEIEGVALKKGEQIGLLLAAANRDPKKFTEPDRFEPKRNEGAPLSFGAGLHFCIGAPLARLELQTALPVLFERLPGLSLKEQPRARDSFHFHGLERLDLCW